MEIDLHQVKGTLERGCEVVGLNAHPFLVDWYNDSVVSERFQLQYPRGTVAFLLLSTPSMFEKLFLPYVTSTDYVPCQLDPLDQCMKQFFFTLTSSFPSLNVEVIQDFEVDPVSRRPRVLVQTAGHVAGVARYYQRDDVNPAPWPERKRIYGVSVHPKYGGWFAFRGVVIIKNLQEPSLPRSDPVDCVPSQEDRVRLLHLYNFNWRDWTFRDVVAGGVAERYSQLQRDYFSTEPARRPSLIQKLRTQCGVDRGGKEKS